MPANYYSDEDADDVLSLQSRASKRRTASMSRNRRIMGDTISAEEFKDVFKLFDQTQDGNPSNEFSYSSKTGKKVFLPLLSSCL